jgi:hypothetical protein
MLIEGIVLRPLEDGSPSGCYIAMHRNEGLARSFGMPASGEMPSGWLGRLFMCHGFFHSRVCVALEESKDASRISTCIGKTDMTVETLPDLDSTVGREHTTCPAFFL